MSEMLPPAVISDRTQFADGELVELYDSVGWSVYSKDPESLSRAVANSTYVVTARSGGKLVGLARGLSDDASIFYLQDILVHTDYRRMGIGRALLAQCLERFAHVRSKVLLTDDLPAQHRFYEDAGYVNTQRTTNPGLHAFVQIAGVDAPSG